jgi:acyl dehydratase
MALTQTPIELSEDESDLASRLIAAVNVPFEDFNGDGLFIRPKDSVSTCTEEDRVVFAMSTEDRGPIITKEILAKRWGIGLNTAH